MVPFTTDRLCPDRISSNSMRIAWVIHFSSIFPALIFAWLAPLLNSCSSTVTEPVQSGHDPPADMDIWQWELSLQPHPKEIVQQADAYYDSLPKPQRSVSRDEVRLHYLEGFFMGYTSPMSKLMGGNDAVYRRGFQAGQKFWRSHPDKIKETMEAFGYRFTKVNGAWIVGFEWSDFRPRSLFPSKKWWLSNLTASDFGRISRLAGTAGGISIHVSGYLSPKGSYGHMGDYAHELFVTEISESKSH